jgi:hypothetical protein
MQMVIPLSPSRARQVVYSFLCPACNGLFDISDEHAGVTFACPNCGQSIEVVIPDVELVSAEQRPALGSAPTAAAEHNAPFDFAKSEGDSPKRVKKQSLAPLFVPLLLISALLCSCVLAGLFLIFFRSRNADSERHKDYFVALEAGYEREAMLEMAVAWGDGYLRTFKDRDAHTAASIVSDEARSTSEILETKQLRLRQAFVARHGIDETAWKPAFASKYPEKAVIYDEIKVEVRRICNRQLLKAHSHLTDKLVEFQREFPGQGVPRLEARYSQYRAEYLQRQAPNMVMEVRNAIENLRSITNLKKKVLQGA